MNKTYIFLLLGLISSLINAQQFYNIPNNLKDSNRSIKDAFTITNQETKNLTLFIDDNKTFNAYVYDKAMDRLDELSSVGLPNRYDEILGYIQKENRTILFLKHRNNKEFGAIVYDFKSNETKEIQFDIKFKNEEFVEVLSKNNKFYIISVDEKSSKINFYEFGGISYNKHTIHLDYNFRIERNQPQTLHQMLSVSEGLGSNLEIEKIENYLPVSVQMASSMNKFYETTNGFDLSLDKSIYETYIISVDVSSYEYQIHQFEKPKYSSTETFYGNSFLLDNNIFQLVANSDELYFQVINRESGESLKKLTLKKDESIDFKNSPIIQDKVGDIYAPHRELEKTSKFLRKIDNENIAISVYKVAFGYQITMGSYNEIQQGGPMMMGMPGMSMSMGNGFGLVASAYFSYSYGKSVRIECLFDEQFRHLDGKPRKNIFDIIKDYSKVLQDSGNAETVFEWNNDIYYGYYSSVTESYRLLKF